jgi:hypothetical protein
MYISAAIASTAVADANIIVTREGAGLESKNLTSLQTYAIIRHGCEHGHSLDACVGSGSSRISKISVVI